MKRERKINLGVLVLALLLVEIIQPLSAKRLRKKDVLSVQNGEFYLDGKHFAEISFNKFDLFWDLWDAAMRGETLDADNAAVLRQSQALRELSENGFQTIRIFGAVHGSRYSLYREAYLDPERREKIIYKIMDTLMELCRQNHIRMVYSLGCDIFLEEGEHPRDLIGNPQSKSRRFLYTYLQDIVQRYKDNPSIVMWEISNEVTLNADILPGELVYDGKRMPTMQQVAGFYKDITTLIHSIDPLRLINNGGSIMREYAYGLNHGRGWSRKDTYDEQLQMYQMVFRGTGIDVMDVHYYMNPFDNRILDERGDTLEMRMKDIKKIADFLSLPAYVGEMGVIPQKKSATNYWNVLPEGWFEQLTDEDKGAELWMHRLLEDALDSGIGLMHWWCYQADREQDQNDAQRMDIDVERTPHLFRMIVEANKKLKVQKGIR